MLTINGKPRRWERDSGYQELKIGELHCIPFTVVKIEDGRWYTNYGSQRYHRTCKAAKLYVEGLIKSWAKRIK